MKTTTLSLAELRNLRNRKNFVEERYYPGAPNEEIRVRCEARANEFLDALLALLEHDAPREEILRRAKVAIELFQPEDTEESEKLVDYIGESMRAIGLDNWTEFI